MEKPDSTSGSGGSSVLNTVFIDTSLDTHLALIVSDSDTVSDLKKKILYEHPLCFPNMGEIKINALKVKRKGYHYHLSDSMFVKSAFEGIRKSWFLSADASSAEDRENHNSHKPDAGNVVACFGIRTNSSADVVDLLPAGTSKRLSQINGASLPEDGNNCHFKQNSASQQFGFSNSKENSEDLLMEVENTADSNSKVLFPSNNSESIPNIKDVGDNKVCEDFLAASVLKDKRKIRKRKKDAIHDHDVNENDALIVQSGKDVLDSDNVLRENLFQNGSSAVCNDMNLVDKTSRSLSSDISKRSASRKRMADEVTKVSGECSECETDKHKDVSVGEQEYKLTENSSQSGPPSKKKYKAEKKDGNENSLTENGVLISDCVKQGTGPNATASDLGQKPESTGTILDHLNTVPVKENHSLAGIASGGGKKRKKQKPNPSEVGSEISTVEGVNVNNLLAIEAINHKDLGSEADTGVVLGKIYTGGAITEPCLISSMEMQEGSKTSRVPCSGGDDDMADTNDGNMERENEAHEPDVASVIKTRDAIDQNANHVEGNPTLVPQEAIRLQNDIGVSGYENQSDTLEDKIGEPKRSAKKIKKTKKKKDLVGVQEAVDEVLDRGPTSDIPPAEHPTSDTNDGNVERKNEAHDPAVASIMKTRDSIDQNANHVKGNPTLVPQVARGLQNDIEVSGSESQSGKLEDKTVEPKKSAKKIKKTKKKEDPVGGQEAVDEVYDRGPTSDTNDGNVERKNEAHEPAVASVMKTRDSIDQNANHVEGNPTLVPLEAIGLQNDIRVSGSENQSDTLEDKMVEPKKSAKKIKKTKKKKDLVGVQEALDAVLDRGPTSDIPPAEHPTSDTNDGNVERKNEAHEPAVASIMKTRDSIDQNANHVEGNPTLVPQVAGGLQNDIGVSRSENQSGKLEDKTVEPKKSAKKIKKTKKKRDLVGGQAVDEVYDRDPISDMPPAEHPTSDTNDGNVERKNEAHEPAVASVMKTRDSIDQNANHVEGNPTLVPLEAIGLQNDIGVSGSENQSGTSEDKMVEPKKSAKKIKKTKKKNDQVGGQEAVDEVHDRGPTSDVPLEEHPTSVGGDHLSDNAELDGTTDVRADDVIRDVLESLQQCNNGSANVDMDKKSGKKTKRKRSTVVDPSQLQGKDDVDHRDTAVSANNVSEVSASSKSTRKTVNANSSSAAQLNRSDFRSKNNTEIGISPNQTQLDLSQNILKSNHEGRPIQDVVNVDQPKSTHVDDADNSIEVPCESESIKTQHQHEFVDSVEISVDKTTNKKVMENQEKEKKKKKKPDVQSGQSRPSLQSSQMLNGNQHNEAKVQVAKSSSIQSQRSPSSVEPHSSDVESKAQMPIDINPSRAHTHLEKNNAHAVSRSTLDRSKNSINLNRGNEHRSYPDIAKATGSNNSTNLNKGGSEYRSYTDIAKATGSNNGKVVNNLANKKSLLATVGTIFKHDDKKSSDDEDGVDNSDSSTRTPSDSSSSSDRSDDSDLNVTSSRNGSYNLEGEEGGGRNRKKAGTPTPKSMSLHAILRNSSSYKKAKLSASQDLDSQHDEFVPDSQAT